MSSSVIPPPVGRTCQLHGGEAERFGTLIDPNGHRWFICAECINELWHRRQAMVMDEDFKQRAVEYVLGLLGQLLLEGGSL